MEYFVVSKGKLVKADEPLDPLLRLGPSPLWINLLSPTPSDIQLLEELFHISLSNSPNNLSTSAIRLNLNYISITEKELFHTFELSFVLSKHQLITINPKGIPLLPSSSTYDFSSKNALDLLLLMLLEQTQQLDNNLQSVETNLEELSQEVFQHNRASELATLIVSIGHNSDLVFKIHHCLKDLANRINLLENDLEENWTTPSKKVQSTALEILSANNNTNTLEYSVEKAKYRFKKMRLLLESLKGHSSLLSSKCNMLLDATMGLINIEQNQIIKIFSVVAVLFLPPTLIASIYGMNFEHMPELKWIAGYPMSLLMMITSAIIPIVYFKRKGWL